TSFGSTATTLSFASFFTTSSTKSRLTSSPFSNVTLYVLTTSPSSPSEIVRVFPFSKSLSFSSSVLYEIDSVTSSVSVFTFVSVTVSPFSSFSSNAGLILSFFLYDTSLSFKNSLTVPSVVQTFFSSPASFNVTLNALSTTISISSFTTAISWCDTSSCLDTSISSSDKNWPTVSAVE